ncbi:endonuclease/exonuclease/phosphatase family protein [Pseudoalteromonas sp. NEC-BIFX-2020_015]|uniref:endonuclease/exonuclease/phosphatase family protein n=1 Tax=Pseudoalteromonas sp. NEC-BIFX-2020_015 TaxID=2729544 RepID=UPI0014616FE1|nr:endonuclease/exonuclease/phosphatase family protein [Pseudoalteromonas sp. NEC-BIFX-2020_015]NMR23952.1 endonuclease/exonuclease/phosphatase family protein [Pseudoalteromonas sp. NEC-BIFX-2020_015]
MHSGSFLHDMWLLTQSYVPIFIVFFGAMFCLIWRKLFIGLGLCAVSLSLYFYLSFGFNQVDKIDENLTVITFSLRSGNEQKIADINSIILSHSPDILLLQEGDKGEDFRNTLNNLFPDYQYISDENKRTALMTKLTVKESEFIGNIQKVIIEVGAEELLIYNFHAPKFFLNYENYQRFYSRLFTDINQSTIKKIIVAGDFNVTRNNLPRKILVSDYSFEGALSKYGSGFINTFPGPKHRIGWLGSLISIDEIYTKGISLKVGKTLNIKTGSDHKPVIAYMDL